MGLVECNIFKAMLAIPVFHFPHPKSTIMKLAFLFKHLNYLTSLILIGSLLFSAKGQAQKAKPKSTQLNQHQLSTESETHSTPNKPPQFINKTNNFLDTSGKMWMKKPNLIPYQEFRLHEPVSAAEAEKITQSDQGLPFLTNMYGPYATTTDELIILQNGEQLSAMLSEGKNVVPTKLSVKLVDSNNVKTVELSSVTNMGSAYSRTGSKGIIFTPLDNTGIFVYNFKMVLVVGSELSFPSDQWTTFGNIKFKSDKIILRKEGIEIISGLYSNISQK